MLAGQNLIPLFNRSGLAEPAELRSRRAMASRSPPVIRCGAAFRASDITYGYDISNITTLKPTAASPTSTTSTFSGIGGPNSLEGIRTSRIIPSFTYNTVNHPITPTGGKSLFISVCVCGQRSGRQRQHRSSRPSKANTSSPRPGIGRTSWRSTVLGSMITGYGGKEIPPFSRTYIGGEKDIRGFQIWGISPDRVHAQRSHHQCAEQRRIAAHPASQSERGSDAGQRYP